MGAYKLYKCNKCGFVFSTDSDTAPTVCTYPMETRTSGICGGSFKLVLSSNNGRRNWAEI